MKTGVNTRTKNSTVAEGMRLHIADDGRAVVYDEATEEFSEGCLVAQALVRAHLLRMHGLILGLYAIDIESTGARYLHTPTGTWHM